MGEHVDQKHYSTYTLKIYHRHRIRSLIFTRVACMNKLKKKISVSHQFPLNTTGITIKKKYFKHTLNLNYLTI